MKTTSKKNLTSILRIISIATLSILIGTNAFTATPASEFNVDMTEDGTGVIITRYIGKSSNIVVPDTIEGYPVKEIGENAFSVNVSFNSDFTISNNIKSVILPNTIKKIGNMAFQYCNMESIVIPDSVEEIGSYAFSSMNRLSSIKFPSGTIKIKGSAFSETKIKSLTITKNMIFEDANWFDYCPIENVIVETGVESLPDYLVRSNILKSVTFKDEQTIIEENTFNIYNLNLTAKAEVRKHIELGKQKKAEAAAELDRFNKCCDTLIIALYSKKYTREELVKISENQNGFTPSMTEKAIDTLMNKNYIQEKKGKLSLTSFGNSVFREINTNNGKGFRY